MKLSTKLIPFDPKCVSTAIDSTKNKFKYTCVFFHPTKKKGKKRGDKTPSWGTPTFKQLLRQNSKKWVEGKTDGRLTSRRASEIWIWDWPVQGQTFHCLSNENEEKDILANPREVIVPDKFAGAGNWQLEWWGSHPLADSSGGLGTSAFSTARFCRHLRSTILFARYLYTYLITNRRWTNNISLSLK